MKKLFPRVFDVKVTVPSFIILLVVAFIACAGINTCIGFLHLPNLIELVCIGLCTLYFSILVIIALLNLLGVVKVNES